MKTIRVALVDDHKIFLRSLNAFFEDMADIDVVYQASSGETFISDFSTETPPVVDVLLLDLKMNEVSGLDCLDFIREKELDLRTIILSMFDESPFIHQAIKKGAKGYITKESNPDSLTVAIRTVFETGFYINEHLSKTLINNINEKQNASLILSPTDLISSTEFEVLQLICLGYTAEEIGAALYRSKRTIEGHRQNLLDKTNSKNVASLVAWAFREGLVS